MRRLLSLALVTLLVALVHAQDPSGPSPEELATAKRSLATALAKFDKALPRYDAAVREDAPFLRGLLTDYYYHRVEMTQSEGQLAEALLDDLGLGAFGSRGELSPLLEGGKEMHSHGASPAPKAAPRRAARISGLRSKPTFASGSDRLPGGREIGYVTLSIEGRTKRIVEVPGTRTLQPGRRAATIAKRLRTVSAHDPLWWMKLRTSPMNGEFILAVPRSSVPLIITADAPFAKEWGTTPQELAGRLRTKIRRTYDDMGADGVKGRGGDRRDDAIEYRQEGDELAATDPEGAIASYRSAIGADAGYLMPYLRIVSILRNQGKGGMAEAVLREAVAAEGMSEADRKTARDAMKE